MVIEVVRGNITKMNSDAIVNAANKNLLAGSGVCGAIHEAAGPDLEKECSQIGYCEVGTSVITPGYKLDAKFVIHTVGPNYNLERDNAEELLASAYRSIFNVCKDNGVKSVAIPCISTGIYGFPKERAAEIAVRTAMELAASSNLETVTFCCFEEVDLKLYQDLLSDSTRQLSI